MKTIDEDRFEEILEREYEGASMETKEAILRIREQVKYITHESKD